MVYVRGCRGNPYQWMNYIILKTFRRQDEVVIHKQWDLEMGRKGEIDREGGGREREGRGEKED